MIAGELDRILRTLPDASKDYESRKEMLKLIRQIENDATEICHEKYESNEVIKFNTASGKIGYTTSLGRQSVKSQDCIRLAIRKNLTFMNERVKAAFQSYFKMCE
jgi:hypothetical protein